MAIFFGKNGAKRWIIESRDLEKMYSVFKEGTEIHLWCETKFKPDDELEPQRKRPKTGGTTRREIFEDEVDEIFRKLKEKHHDMTAPKLRLWARLIQSGRYDDYEQPPNIPLISGSSVKSKDTMKEAFIGATTAVVQML